MTRTILAAGEWPVSEWLNTREPVTPATLRGRVVVVLAFQMLCPGCVAHALPMASRIHRLFPQDRVAVIGLHTVFEHHAAMTPVALRAFLHEYRVQFPVAVDRPGSGDPIPGTMRAYRMRGTPTWLLYDSAGQLRQQFFGEIDPLQLGAEIMRLIEARADVRADTGTAADLDTAGCGPDGCTRPDR